MKSVLIDANVLLSFVTDRNPEQQEKASRLLRSTADIRVKVLCHQHVLSEFVYVLDSVYEFPKTQVAAMLDDFASLPGVEIVTVFNLPLLLDLWPDKITDYGDALIATVALNLKGCRVATFDKKFAKSLQRLGVQVFEF